MQRFLLGASAFLMATVMGALLATSQVSLSPSLGPSDHVTVLTMAPDGAWGAATETYFGDALTKAIRNCRKLSGAELGCGSMFRAVRAGWIVGLRCGNENIIATGRDRLDAERAARERECELQTKFRNGMPPCTPVALIDPYGAVTHSGELGALPEEILCSGPDGILHSTVGRNPECGQQTTLQIVER